MLRNFVLFLSENKSLKKFITNFTLIKEMAGRFVVGDTLQEAVPRVREINKMGMNVTMDHLGEHVNDTEEADASADAYLNLLDTIQKERLKAHISIKLTQMGLSIDREFCINNVEKIIKKAREYENFVRIDMEGSLYTQETLNIFYSLREKYDNVGIVIQSYLHRSEEDIMELIKKKGFVRLCKGAYEEPSSIAFKNKKDVEDNYLKLTRLLLDSKILNEGYYPAIATHDVKMIIGVKKYVREQNIEPNKFEFQMLYGVRRDLQKILRDEGYNVRLYVPYGREWYAYYLRRLGERTDNVTFLLRNLMLD
ncbi:MAG TPA: proline dehydrogenase family protein [Candidatus Eremiobacteraeota bacterium]|nr:MAG: Proline dehydrogenase 1 [bacterium ADurb.Bin363]HPZ06490.1 proline dehydrogenase family protein [Candidatus Eremiobacteraeota bacterium]